MTLSGPCVSIRKKNHEYRTCTHEENIKNEIFTNRDPYCEPFPAVEEVFLSLREQLDLNL